MAFVVDSGGWNAGVGAVVFGWREQRCQFRAE
jgi:hypothetical protein